MITLTFACDGCDAVAEGKQSIRRTFEHVTRNFGRWLPFDIDDAIPDGWTASDPYTGCCYCPACWQSIEDGVEAAEASALHAEQTIKGES